MCLCCMFGCHRFTLICSLRRLLDMAADPPALRVLTANICVFPTGLRNRPLADLTQKGSLIVFVITFLLMLAVRPASYSALFAWPMVAVVVAIVMAIPLARFCGAVIHTFCPDYNDFKAQRIRLFLDFLDKSDCDVVCVQECFNSWLFPSTYVEDLIRGAKNLGYHYVAPGTRRVDFWSWRGFTDGLLVLSKRPVVRHVVMPFPTQVFFERSVVPRAALYCEVEGGMHIFTCHMSPTAESCGPFKCAASFIDAARDKQAQELAAFIQREAPASAPVVLAGDLNLSLHFKTESDRLRCLPCPKAAKILNLFADSCGLAEATFACRADSKALRTQFAGFQPTCNFTGRAPAIEGEGAPEERFLSTFSGDGTPVHVCEDAVLFRGCQAVAIEELPMHVLPELRPCKQLTHISDHWAMRATFAL
eukprot:TRINITY_DN81612_c0_g1_i1.p1 TRINITY_DN81612_c0_g1~~TRINITY_DN81612_c0_g1_i1.p1  ORF type:complete len:420 (-),score=45.24 TRINITY_DN81612_c0_g1_i1:399-1658(-)